MSKIQILKWNGCMKPILGGLSLLLSLLSLNVFSANCPSSDTLAAITSPCTVNGSQSNFELNFITGFTSTISLAAIDGNPGNTVGTQRQYSFIKAAEILANQVKSSVTLVVDASFQALECESDIAVLGSAGATTNFRHPSAPAGINANTFYPVGLYNAISQTDNHIGVSDITADFNQNLGNLGCLQDSNGWYYGFGTPGINDIGFTTVLLHELTHGLGFASLVDLNTGAKPDGLNDVFSNLLFDSSLDKPWPSLSNSQRANSAKSGNGLLWNGSQVNTQAQGNITNGFKDNDGSGSFTSGDKVQMFAPNPIENGSSISHFNTSVAPNELMEPEYTEGQYSLGLALFLLQDLGWTVISPTQVEPDGHVFVEGGTLDIAVTDTQINIAGGSNNITASLMYLGLNVSTLLTVNAQGVVIGLPENGPFAGTYTLTVQNNASGNPMTMTLQRPPRLRFSSTSILGSDKGQTLRIEGGASGSQYSLSQSPRKGFTFVNSSGNTQSTFTAANNSNDFNAAVVGIHSEVVTELTEIQLTVSTLNESYKDATQDLLLYPTASHRFAVTDTNTEAIADVNALLSGSDVLTTLNVPLIYQGDNLGEFSMALPNNTDNFTLALTAPDFNATTLSFNNTQLTHSVQMTSMGHSITLSGTLKALGLGLAAQDFLRSPPSLSLVFSDDSQELITLVADTKTQTHFSHSMDLNLQTPSHFSVSQSESLDLKQDIKTIEDKRFELFLEPSQTHEPASTTLRSSGGGPMAVYWLLFIGMVVRRKKQSF
jgi:hypothetical protein